MSSAPAISISEAFSGDRNQAHGVTSSFEASQLQGATLSPTRLTSDSPSDEESIIQPGAPLFKLPDPLSGTLTKGDLIGAGAYANVYKGEWTAGGMALPVAIKCIRETHLHEADPRAKRARFERRLMRETVIWEKTNHENILPFYGHQVVDNEPMLVSPWCKNGNLLAFIRRNPGLNEVEKLKLVHGAARGLEYLHSRKPPIVHADIKPENIVINDNLTSCLCDFGIARVMTALGAHTGLTTAGQGVGTAGYQGPELFREDAVPTTMSDIYAFGGLMLAVMSGDPPFHQFHKSPATIIIKINIGVSSNPKDHLGLPSTDPLWTLLKQCWESTPEKRPSMAKIVETLEFEIKERSRANVS